MAISSQPSVILSDLYRADGSANFSQNGYTVIGSVNGPIEVQRRDELPEEASIDVIIRPAAGVGGTRERHLESILQSTLRQIILIHNFPRTLIQITLQITSTPENDYAESKIVQASSNLPIIPALLHTAILALLSASTPLVVTATSAIVALDTVGEHSRVIRNPSIHQIEGATSVHVFGFTSQGFLLLVESEGAFSVQDWDLVYEAAKGLCCGGPCTDHEMATDNEDNNSGAMHEFMKAALQSKVSTDFSWKAS